jgi:opacity protein-like surface antigen
MRPVAVGGEVDARVAARGESVTKFLIVIAAVLLAASAVRADEPVPRASRFYGGVSLAAFFPTGQELRDTYTLGFGGGVELGMALDRWLRIVAAATPTYCPGSPVSGPLAADGRARLWSVPLSLGARITPRAHGRLRPYAGGGVTVLYVDERLSFASGLGNRTDSRSHTAVGVHGTVGLEQNRDRGLFGELSFIHARAGGIDDGSFAQALGGLQFRIGYRGRLR